MLDTLLPASIMFLITVFIVAVFFLPILSFKKKNKLISFYWIGTWGFIVAIAAIAGGQSTLMLLDYNADEIANAMLTGITGAFVAFVVFAWFRLSAKALWVITKYFTRKTN